MLIPPSDDGTAWVRVGSTEGEARVPAGALPVLITTVVFAGVLVDASVVAEVGLLPCDRVDDWLCWEDDWAFVGGFGSTS